MDVNYVFNVLKPGKPREQLLQDCIQYKLAANEEAYEESLREAADYILGRDNAKVMRALAAEERREERLAKKAMKKAGIKYDD